MRGWFTRKAAPAVASSTLVALPPASYAQWSQCLEALAVGDNDEACLVQLQSGQLEWTGGVAPILGKRLSEEIQRRLTLCNTRMERDLKMGSHESALVRAILQARVQLYFVHRMIQLPIIPDSTQQHLSGQVRDFAERAQHSLEESAKADRSGKLTSLLRHNPLTRYAEPPAPQPLPANAAEPPPAHAAPTSGRKRTILL